MNKLKKTLLFYVLGTVLAFGVLALIHLNYSILKDFFWRSSWQRVCKNAIIYGAPVGVVFWIFLTYKFPTRSLNFKFIVNFLKPYFYKYLIGILLALILVEVTQLYIYLFDANYFYATYYNIFGISVLLGVPMAVGYQAIKTL